MDNMFEVWYDIIKDEIKIYKQIEEDCQKFIRDGERGVSMFNKFQYINEKED